MLHLLERLVELESGTSAGRANMITCVGLLILVLSDTVWRFVIEVLDKVLWFILAVTALVKKQPLPDGFRAAPLRSDSALRLPIVTAAVFVACPITINIVTH